ncbi:hypothetical protein FHW58_004630 [Duganella sp. 1224]|uniref:hypothetical protein n=1 Tax=Duganella sp. 1224 TaxID=2587052 RepID=UPI00182FC428|nr:hypothetical protein [Duganella sp. 1224]NYE63400.1 hypothetical protein [Duganella sp. 1224]
MNIARYLLSAVLTLLPGGCTTQEPHLKQSVTYLHLLRKTPFFTRLDKSQLQWVIDHSTEWEATAGMEISNRRDADDHLWILLDGGWQIEQGGQVLKAGHADPAKWYGGPYAGLLPADSRLVVNQHSYVMRIKRADVDDMLQRGFDFTPHLQQGQAFYGARK